MTTRHQREQLVRAAEARVAARAATLTAVHQRLAAGTATIDDAYAAEANLRAAEKLLEARSEAVTAPAYDPPQDPDTRQRRDLD